jgi:hypothetical protein
VKKILMPILICFAALQAVAQKQDKISGYFLFDYNTTLYDRTLGNNPSGVGIGIQTMINTKSIFSPLIEINAQGSLEDDDVFRLTKNGEAVPDARGIINAFAGSAFRISNHFNFSFDMGPSFINSNTYFGIKPSCNFYFSKKKRITAQVSYLNIFNRTFNYEETKKVDFGSLNLSLGIKLF